MKILGGINGGLPVDRGMSEDTKAIIVVLLLIFVYPVGVVLMYVWMKKWLWWVKLLIALPIALLPLAFLGILAAVVLVAVNPGKQMEKARMAKLKSDCNFICLRAAETVIEEQREFSQEDCQTRCVLAGEEFVEGELNKEGSSGSGI